jgi:hypothetical protein
MIVPESPGSQAAKAVSAIVPAIMTIEGSKVLIKTSENRRDENLAGKARPTTYIGGNQTTVGGDQRNDQGDHRDWRDNRQNYQNPSTSTTTTTSGGAP